MFEQQDIETITDDVSHETIVEDVPPETITKDVTHETITEDVTPEVEEKPKRKPRKPREPRAEQLQNEPFDLVPPPAKKRKKASGNAKTMASVLAVLHSTIFSLVGAAHLDLSADENLALATALDNLADEYEVTVDSKTAAWLNLAMVAGSIYGTRAFMIYQLNQAVKNEQANQTA